MRKTAYTLENSGISGLGLKDFFKMLLDNTDPEGNVYIPDEESACSLIDSNDVFHLVMDWDGAAVEQFLKEANDYRKAFAEIAKVSKQINDNEETAKSLLSPENFNIWKTYIKGFDENGFDMEEIGSINEKLDSELSKEEKDLIEKWGESVRTESAKRMGKELYAYYPVIHAMRYVKLLEMGVAPDVVLDNEFRLFAMDQAIFQYAKSVEVE